MDLQSRGCTRSGRRRGPLRLADVGPAFISHAVARPNLYRLLPRRFRIPGVVSRSARTVLVAETSIARCKHLHRPRCDFGERRGDQVDLKLSDGSHELVDQC